MAICDEREVAVNRYAKPDRSPPPTARQLGGWVKKMEKRKLALIEQYIFDVFRQRAEADLLAKEIFDSTSKFSNADLVRAFEDLEKKWRLLVRHTTEGNDWVTLTADGAEYAGIDATPRAEAAFPHPPRSIT